MHITTTRILRSRVARPFVLFGLALLVSLGLVSSVAAQGDCYVTVKNSTTVTNGNEYLGGTNPNRVYEIVVTYGDEFIDLWYRGEDVTKPSTHTMPLKTGIMTLREVIRFRIHVPQETGAHIVFRVVDTSSVNGVCASGALP